MKIGPTFIKDSFAEAFRMRYIRIIVTAHDQYWLEAAVRAATGCATSVIACDVEAGLEQWLRADQTIDGRPGTSLLMFGFSGEQLGESVVRRVGQCILTCPTTAVFDGMPKAEERVPLGKYLRFFGDGYQKSKLVGERRYWRVPVMDGEFLVEEMAGIAKGIAGGNIILQCVAPEVALNAARRVVDALAGLPNVIVPFPGGVVRSGSKVGSKYKGIRGRRIIPIAHRLRDSSRANFIPRPIARMKSSSTVRRKRTSPRRWLMQRVRRPEKVFSSSRQETMAES